MAVLPISTRRLHLRLMQPCDADIFASYRNDPAIAEYQYWPLPYSLERANAILAGQVGTDDLRKVGWSQIAIELDGAMVGDVAIGINEAGRVAEVGYTLTRAAQGFGYASEALSGIVDALFDQTDVHRIVASVDPANIASMRVLEGQGFVVEGYARQALLIRGEWLDDLTYAILKEERRAWIERPRTYQHLELVELHTDNIALYSRLSSHRSQEHFVAPMWASMRDALFPEVIDGAAVVPWMRGVEVDGEPAGFVMLAAVTPAHPDPYLWRLLIDRLHQRRGIGSAVISALAAQLRDQGCARLLTSWTEGPGGPRPFYERHGFHPTGNVIEGETEGVLDLTVD